MSKARGSQSQLQYHPGDVVWAKIDPYPWWPARVILPEEARNFGSKPPKVQATKTLVEFFNDNCRFANVRRKDIRRFSERPTQVARGRAEYVEGVRTAVEDAELYITWMEANKGNDIPWDDDTLESARMLNKRVHGTQRELSVSPTPVRKPTDAPRPRSKLAAQKRAGNEKLATRASDKRDAQKSLTERKPPGSRDGVSKQSSPSREHAKRARQVSRLVRKVPLDEEDEDERGKVKRRKVRSSGNDAVRVMSTAGKDAHPIPPVPGSFLAKLKPDQLVTLVLQERATVRKMKAKYRMLGNRQKGEKMVTEKEEFQTLCARARDAVDRYIAESSSLFESSEGGTPEQRAKLGELELDAIAEVAALQELSFDRSLLESTQMGMNFVALKTEAKNHSENLTVSLRGMLEEWVGMLELDSDETGDDDSFDAKDSKELQGALELKQGLVESPRKQRNVKCKPEEISHGPIPNREQVESAVEDLKNDFREPKRRSRRAPEPSTSEQEPEPESKAVKLEYGQRSRIIDDPMLDDERALLSNNERRLETGASGRDLRRRSAPKPMNPDRMQLVDRQDVHASGTGNNRPPSYEPKEIYSDDNEVEYNGETHQRSGSTEKKESRWQSVTREKIHTLVRVSAKKILMLDEDTARLYSEEVENLIRPRQKEDKKGYYNASCKLINFMKKRSGLQRLLKGSVSDFDDDDETAKLVEDFRARPKDAQVFYKLYLNLEGTPSGA